MIESPVPVLFFDGKTGKEIRNDSGAYSKAGGASEHTIIDLNPNDPQKEILLQTSGGGTIANYHGLTILKFDESSQSMQSIFTTSISDFYWDEKREERLSEVFYVDILYKKEHLNEIKIYKGKFIDKVEPYNLHIKPVGKIQEYYLFNPKTNKFDKQNL